MEMARTLQAIQKLPSNCLFKNPAGTWSFAGSVDCQLGYRYKDGRLIESDDDVEAIRKAHRFGLGFSEFCHRVFPTKEAAIAEAQRLGLDVN